jgi:thiol-disulfide isomerase/thioredoxin
MQSTISNALMNYKNIFLVLILIFSGCKGKSQQKTESQAPTINNTTVNWYKSIDQALADAKAQNKMLFVECFTPTCPVCMSMEPIFKKPEVIKKYNTDFINYKLDVGIAEQVKFLTTKNIVLASFPQFLYFDADGNLVHQADIIADSKSFTTAADNAQNTATRSSSLKNRFTNGERGLDFLINYAAFTRLTKDTLNNFTAADEIFKIYPKDQLSSETSWKITKKCVTDLDNGFAQHWFKNIAKASAFEKKDGHDGSEFNILGTIIQFPLYGPKGKTYSVAKLQEVKRFMGLANAGQYAEVATWELEARALIKENRGKEALALGDKIFTKFKDNVASLLYITKVFNDDYKDPSYATYMKKWLDKIKTMASEDKFKVDYLYESARFSKKMGDIPSAKNQAKEGRSIAAKINADLGKFNAIIE